MLDEDSDEYNGNFMVVQVTMNHRRHIVKRKNNEKCRFCFKFTRSFQTTHKSLVKCAIKNPVKF